MKNYHQQWKPNLLGFTEIWSVRSQVHVSQTSFKKDNSSKEGLPRLGEAEKKAEKREREFQTGTFADRGLVNGHSTIETECVRK